MGLWWNRERNQEYFRCASRKQDRGQFAHPVRICKFLVRTLNVKKTIKIKCKENNEPLLYTRNQKFFSEKDDIVRSVFSQTSDSIPSSLLFTVTPYSFPKRIVDVLFDMAKLGVTLLPLHIIRFLDSFEKCYSLIPITNLTCILCNIPNARISSWKFGGQWFEDDFCVLDIHIFDFSLTKLQSLDSLYTMIINFNHLIVFSTNNFDDIK